MLNWTVAIFQVSTRKKTKEKDLDRQRPGIITAVVVFLMPMRLKEAEVPCV